MTKVIATGGWRAVKKAIRNCFATLHATAGLLLMVMSLDPYVGDMQDFYFPCEPCGWHYGTKFTYFLTFAVPGALLLISAVLAWRAKLRLFISLGLTLLPATSYLWVFLLSRPA